LGALAPQAVGNIKFDQVLSNGEKKMAAFALPDSDKLIFVAGSIRRGEDTVFADLISSAHDKKLPVLFVLVPRHMKDVQNLCDLLKGRNITYKLWSEIKGDAVDSDSVLVVNTMGELASFYLAADLTFVGGSLVPIGGHDPAEPAALGKPVLFGPYMENSQVAADLLIKSGGAQIVKDGNDLFGALCNAVANRIELAANGKRCREAILSMAGISKKIAAILIGDSK
jgi:3-deoxy-D-manno-octulosonic-acid transferase